MVTVGGRGGGDGRRGLAGVVDLHILVGGGAGITKDGARHVDAAALSGTTSGNK